MSEADADEPYPLLCQHLLRELDQLQDPWVIVERVVFCSTVGLISQPPSLFALHGVHTAASQEYRVDIVQIWVMFCVDHIELRDIQLWSLHAILLRYLVCAGLQ